MDVCLGNPYLLGEIDLVCWEIPHPAQATGTVQSPQVASSVAVVSVQLHYGETLALVLVSSQDKRGSRNFPGNPL